MELTRLVSESPAVTLKGLFLLAASASLTTWQRFSDPAPPPLQGGDLQSVFNSFPCDSDASVSERATVLANYSHPWLLCHGILGPEGPCWSLIPTPLELDITHLVCFLVLFYFTWGVKIRLNEIEAWKLCRQAPRSWAKCGMDCWAVACVCTSDSEGTSSAVS